jgi:hypothetical protein
MCAKMCTERDRKLGKRADFRVSIWKEMDQLHGDMIRLKEAERGKHSKKKR